MDLAPEAVDSRINTSMTGRLTAWVDFRTTVREDGSKPGSTVTESESIAAGKVKPA
jgi:hypothetical protein